MAEAQQLQVEQICVDADNYRRGMEQRQQDRIQQIVQFVDARLQQQQQNNPFVMTGNFQPPPSEPPPQPQHVQNLQLTGGNYFLDLERRLQRRREEDQQRMLEALRQEQQRMNQARAQDQQLMIDARAQDQQRMVRAREEDHEPSKSTRPATTS